MNPEIPPSNEKAIQAAKRPLELEQAKAQLDAVEVELDQLSGLSATEGRLPSDIDKVRRSRQPLPGNEARFEELMKQRTKIEQEMVGLQIDIESEK